MDYKKTAIGTFDEYESFTNTLYITPNLLTEELSFALDDVLLRLYPPQKASYNNDCLSGGENK